MSFDLRKRSSLFLLVYKTEILSMYVRLFAFSSRMDIPIRTKLGLWQSSRQKRLSCCCVFVAECKHAHLNFLIIFFCHVIVGPCLLCHVWIKPSIARETFCDYEINYCYHTSFWCRYCTKRKKLLIFKLCTLWVM
jgi:hypothetical protein